jgi:hypothetical protein
VTSGPVHGRADAAASERAGRRAHPLSELVQGGVMVALRAYFNFLVLNLALLVVSLPLVTAPVAINAAMVALDRWRVDGEDRVVREFLGALRAGPALRTTVAVGAPLVVTGLALEEVHYFARGGNIVDWVCLGFAAAALLVAVVGMGYVFLLWARCPGAPVPDLWTLSVRLAVRNLFVTGPLFVAEIVFAFLLGLADPALLLIGLPLALLFLVRLSADFGARRAGPGTLGGGLAGLPYLNGWPPSRPPGGRRGHGPGSARRRTRGRRQPAGPWRSS